jgi:hypothetical protein
MTRALPFTQDSIARLILGIEKAGKFVVGAKPDGTLIVGEKPIDPTSLAPANEQPSPAVEARRMGDYFHGGPSEAQGS